MKRHVGAVTWLTFVWIALWRDMSWPNLIGGIIVANGVMMLFPFVHNRHQLRPSPAGMLRFLGVFGWSVIKSNIFVAKEVLTPTNTINEGIVAVELESTHPVVITVVNHAINLAPGTFVIDTDEDPCVLYVHVLHLENPDDVRAEVLELEQLARNAFGLGSSAPGPRPASEVMS